jgi:general secretion pathway protein G
MRRPGQRGFTLVELIVAFTILTLLAALSLPLARLKVRRENERELRFELRELRRAIDKYKDACDAGVLGPPKVGTDCYPETLDILVEGVKMANDPTGKKIRFLRRIPRDPFTHQYEWGMRSTQDEPESISWGGQNVFDVFSKTMERAGDGTPYSDW